MAFFEHHSHLEDEKKEEEEEEEENEDHFRHRRLTGDSGIEVCRCQVKRETEVDEEGDEGKEEGKKDEEEGEEAGFLHDSVDCSLRAQAVVQSQLPNEQAMQCGPTSSSVILRGRDSVITME